MYDYQITRSVYTLFIKKLEIVFHSANNILNSHWEWMNSHSRTLATCVIATSVPQKKWLKERKAYSGFQFEGIQSSMSGMYGDGIKELSDHILSAAQKQWWMFVHISLSLFHSVRSPAHRMVLLILIVGH